MKVQIKCKTNILNLMNKFSILLQPDIDECNETKVERCYHTCKNTIGSYHCFCNDGFMFASDKYTCIGELLNGFFFLIFIKK